MELTNTNDILTINLNFVIEDMLTIITFKVEMYIY